MSPLDPSLTLSRVVVAMETMSDDVLDAILYIPDIVRKVKYTNGRKQWIIYWFETSPYTSWSYLGGECLYYNEKPALAIIKSFIKTNRGEL